MAVRTREEIMELINSRIGEDSSDEALALIEDVTDTLNDLETRANGDGKDWKSEAERIDADWRKKYRERFFNSDSNNEDDEDDEDDEPKKLTYESLFKTGE